MKRIPNYGRKGMNPALSQASMEKKVEQQLAASYKRGQMSSAYNSLIAGVMVYDYICNTQAANNDHQEFYDAMKKIIDSGAYDIEDPAKFTAKIREILDTDLPDSVIVDLDPRLAGVFPDVGPSELE